MYKRFEMRRSIQLPVELITSHWDDPIHLMASDLTPGGAYIRSEIIPDAGDKIVCSFELLRGRPEYCFFGEITRVNLVGTALFADGAACALLTGSEQGGPGARVVDTQTVLFPESSHFMGWSFSGKGFELGLSPHVPGFIAEAFPGHVRSFLGRHGLDPEDVDHFALHSGGRRVIEAYGRGLGLSEEALEPAREALRQNGNLSSASVLFSLNEVLARRQPGEGDLGFLAAMGPGFAAEMLLLRW